MNSETSTIRSTRLDSTKSLSTEFDELSDFLSEQQVGGDCSSHGICAKCTDDTTCSCGGDNNSSSSCFITK